MTDKTPRCTIKMTMVDVVTGERFPAPPCPNPPAVVREQNCDQATPGQPTHRVYLCAWHRSMLERHPDADRCADGHPIVVHSTRRLDQDTNP